MLEPPLPDDEERPLALLDTPQEEAFDESLVHGCSRTNREDPFGSTSELAVALRRRASGSAPSP